MNIAGIIAILSSLLGIPIIVFGFIYINNKNRRSLELMRLKNETLRLELEKEKVHLKVLEEENKKYNRIIEDGSGINKIIG